MNARELLDEYDRVAHEAFRLHAAWQDAERARLALRERVLSECGSGAWECSVELCETMPAPPAARVAACGLVETAVRADTEGE